MALTIRKVQEDVTNHLSRSTSSMSLSPHVANAFDSVIFNLRTSTIRTGGPMSSSSASQALTHTSSSNAGITLGGSTPASSDQHQTSCVMPGPSTALNYSHAGGSDSISMVPDTTAPQLATRDSTFAITLPSTEYPDGLEILCDTHQLQQVQEASLFDQDWAARFTEE
jgi:hypothetical protein